MFGLLFFSHSNPSARILDWEPLRKATIGSITSSLNSSSSSEPFSVSCAVKSPSSQSSPHSGGVVDFFNGSVELLHEAELGIAHTQLGQALRFPLESLR